VRTFLIDGNNVIGKDKKLNELKSNPNNNTREIIGRRIERFSLRSNNKVKLFFDGYENDKIILSGLKIIYSNKKTADDLIRDEIDKSKNSKNLIVVTSDGPLSQYAKKNSCTTISSEEFIKNSLNSVSSHNNESAIEEERISRINNDEFKNIFTKED